MRLASPTSRTKFRLRIVLIDAFWAVVAPFLAIALRDPGLLDPGDFPASVSDTYRYALVSIICALLSLLFFRVGDGMSRFFSVHDALVVCGAVACAVASSSLIVFTFTRLEGVPRSTPLIFGLVLGGGLVFTRSAARLFYRKIWARGENAHEPASAPALRRVILIGVSRFAAAAIKLTDYQRPRTVQVVAALDGRSSNVGRKISGVRIVGLLQELDAVVEEYAVHGIEIDEVWLSDDAPLPAEAVERLGERCEARNVPLMRISDAFNLSPPSTESSLEPRLESREATTLGNYFKVKRIIDIVAASALLVVLLPIGLCAAGLTFFDVGAPVLFWQQRMGKNGRKFLLYKFRTYHAPFDGNGRRIPDDERLSRIGRAIRATRVDEIPQLYNVLVGHMSLIGPRPLLPIDQPINPRLRLLVRPGITGWAQVNGGTLVTPEEKDALDVWYIGNASFMLDVKILFRTLLIAFGSEKMNAAALEQAMRWRQALAENISSEANAVDARHAER